MKIHIFESLQITKNIHFTVCGNNMNETKKINKIKTITTTTLLFRSTKPFRVSGRTKLIWAD